MSDRKVNHIRLFAAGIVLVMLSGCVVHVAGDRDDDWQSRQDENRSAIARLDTGMTRDQVLDTLGAPDFSEAFSAGEAEYQIYYYRTQHRHSDGETTRDETTPVVLRDDRLVGWGEAAYQAALAAHKAGH